MNSTPPLDPLEERHRVLVLDDEELVLAALRDTLRLEGYEPVCVQDPVRALEIIQQQRFAVFLTDQQMATLTGLEFLAQAKQIQPDATRILITAVLNLKTVIDAINKGEVYRFIVKPWLREELLVTIKNATQRYELVRNNATLLQRTQDMNQQLVAQVQQVEAQNRELDRLNQALQQNLQRSVELCLRTLEAFNPTLSHQARQVRELSKAMAARLDLPPDQREVLDLSACLHNIGLVGVPRHLITKWQRDPDSLTEAERTTIHQHPTLGQELAGFVHNLEAVGSTIRWHREHFDGTGYPDGLGRDQIPWLARLLAVAVAYATYPHRGEPAAEFIRQHSGAVFDPEAVRAFLRALPGAVLLRGQEEVLLSELRPGMVLARAVYTANGLLLIPAGQALNDLYIERLRNHNELNPITQTLLVYC